MDMKTKCMRFVGYYLAIWIGVLVVLLFSLWPDRSRSTPKVMDSNDSAVQTTDPNQNDNDVNEPTEAEQPDPNSQKSKSIVSLPPKQCLISCLKIVALVLIMGALGACLHGVTSLGFHCSRKKFTPEWTLWYLYRPFVGGILALIFYLIISGGLVSQVNGDDDNFFRLLGLSGLIGLFSKQALIRLRMIFDAIFASEKDEPPVESNGSETQTGPNSPSGDDTTGAQNKDQTVTTPPDKSETQSGSITPSGVETKKKQGTKDA